MIDSWVLEQVLRTPGPAHRSRPTDPAHLSLVCFPPNPRPTRSASSPSEPRLSTAYSSSLPGRGARGRRKRGCQGGCEAGLRCSWLAPRNSSGSMRGDDGGGRREPAGEEDMRRPWVWRGLRLTAPAGFPRGCLLQAASHLSPSGSHAPPSSRRLELGLLPGL